MSPRISVAGGIYAAPFDHQDGCPLGSPRPVEGFSWNRKTLVGFKDYRFAFQVDEEPSLEDEKELVFRVMLMPVKLPLEDSESDDTVIDPTKRLVGPFFLACGYQARYIDEFQESEFDVGFDCIPAVFFHC